MAEGSPRHEELCERVAAVGQLRTTALEHSAFDYYEHTGTWLWLPCPAREPPQGSSQCSKAITLFPFKKLSDSFTMNAYYVNLDF